MALTHPRRRFVRGTSVIEAVLVLPLLLLIVFGLIEYGNLYLHLQQIENIARQGVRTAVTPDATQAQVTAVITQMLTDADLESSGYTVTTSHANPASAERGVKMWVQVEIPYANIAITNAPLIPVPTSIARKVTMSKEGP